MPASQGRISPWIYGLVLVVCITAFLFLFQLGNDPFRDYDEATYAQVINDTLSSGNLLTLRHFTSDWYEKPPLYMWSGMLSAQMFEHKEFAYRLPSAIAGMVCVILVMLITYRITGSFLATFVSSSILLTSPLFLEASRQVRLDVPVTMTMLFAFLCFLYGLRDRRWLVGIGIALSIGILIKSLIALLVLPLFIIYAFLHKDYLWLKDKFFWLGMVFMLMILIPWHMYESMHAGMVFWNDYLFHQVLERFTSNLVGGQSSISHYLKYLFAYGLPWSIVFIVAIFGFCDSAIRKSPYFKVVVTVCAYALFLVAFFFIARTKIIYYLTPLYPFFALSIGMQIYAFYSTLEKEVSRRMVLIITALVLFTGLITTVYVGFHFSPQFAQDARAIDDEVNIASILAYISDPAPVYALDFPHRETIGYYSGGKHIETIGQNANLSGEFFIILLSANHKNYPALDNEHVQAVYRGQFVELLKYSP